MGKIFDGMKWCIVLGVPLFIAYLILCSLAVGPHRINPRLLSMNNLKNLSLATNNYAAEHGSLPAGVSVIDGLPPVSWETQLLFKLDQAALHRAIDFQQPWNAPANAKVFQERLKVFQCPAIVDQVDDNGYFLSHYAANSHVISDQPTLRQDDIFAGDGVSNTLLFGEIGAGFQPWGKPGNFRDPAAGLTGQAHNFGGAFEEVVYFGFCDGRAKGLNRNIDPAVLKALATPDGGETIPDY